MTETGRCTVAVGGAGEGIVDTAETRRLAAVRPLVPVWVLRTEALQVARAARALGRDGTDGVLVAAARTPPFVEASRVARQVRGEGRRAGRGRVEEDVDRSELVAGFPDWAIDARIAEELRRTAAGRIRTA